MKKITKLLTLALIMGISWQGYSQEDCANALALTPGTAQAGDSTGQVGSFPNDNSAPNNPCDAFYNDDEYWFEYTAVETGEKLQLNMTDISDNWAGLFVLDNCPDSAPLCVADDTNNGSTDDLSILTPGLTAGTSYKIFISNFGLPNSTSFTLNSSVIPAPDCPDITNISTTNNVDGSVSLDWDDAVGAINYNYEIQPIGVDQGTAGALVMSSSATSDAMVASGILTDTEQYTLYVVSDCGAGAVGNYQSLDFTYNIPPTNDNCDGIIDLDDVTSPQSGSTIGANTDFTLDCLTNVDAPDVIYSISVPDTFILNFEQIVNDYDSDIRIAYGATCPGDVVIVCFDDPDLAPQEWANDTGADQEVYIVFSGFNATPGTFTFEYSVTPPPTCPDVENFAVSNITTTTADFTWDEVVEATNGYTIEVFAEGADPIPANVLATTTAAAGEIMATVMGLTELTPYDAYITADCDTNGPSVTSMVNFMTTGTPGPNATCDTALVITPGMYIGQIVDANPGNNNGDSLWYSYTPDEDGMATITSCFGGDNDDTRVFVSSGPCDALVPVANDDDGCDIPDTFSSLIQNVALTAGTEYFIQWDDRWSTTEFDWELTYVVDGLDCEAPENIVVSNETGTGADVSWDEAPSATDGYGVVVYAEGDDTTVLFQSPVVPFGTNTYTIDAPNDLEDNTPYDVYVLSLCDLSTTPQEIASSSDPVTFNTILGLEESALVDYTIFPNPANNEINLSAAYSIEKVSVFNMLGQEILTNAGGSTDLTLDISGLQVGTYFMKATINNIEVVERFIKK